MNEAYEQVRRALSILTLARQALHIPLGVDVKRMDKAMNTCYRYMGTVCDLLQETLDILEEVGVAENTPTRHCPYCNLGVMCVVRTYHDQNGYSAAVWECDDCNAQQVIKNIPPEEGPE